MARAGMLVALAAVSAALGVPGAAAGARSPHLWATVNACDTERFPNMMGVRASMPGDGRRTRMYMRFTAQYFNRPRQAWLPVEGSGRSRWILAGSGLYQRREAGYTFGFQAPPAGRSYVMRGLVDMEWRLRGRVIRSARVATRGGRGSTRGADPPGHSASLCEIR